MTDKALIKEDQKRFYTIRATSCLKRMAQDIIELSQIAHEYHQEFGYQDYITWVKEDLKLGTTYGANLLNVFENFGSTTQCVVENIQTSALRLLSAPSTPNSAREEALELAEAGETITNKQAKEITEAHKELETLRLKYAELEAKTNQPPTPLEYSLLSNVQSLLDAGKIMPAKAKAIRTMTPDAQAVWYTDYVQKISAENQVDEKKAELQKIQAQALKAITEKEEALKQLKEFAGQDNTVLISKYETQISLMKDDYNRKLLQDRKDIEKQAKELYSRTNKERLEQIEKEKALAEKREKEAREKASAAWKHNDELTRENKKLQSQLEVDKPTNIDNARALKLSSELKHLEWTFPDIRSEAELAGGEMHETKKVIIEIINKWSSLLQELDNQDIITIK